MLNNGHVSSKNVFRRHKMSLEGENITYEVEWWVEIKEV